MTVIFHGVIGRKVENYVDDLIIKYTIKDTHFENLEKVFIKCQIYNLKINPKKYAFGASIKKFLDFSVHKKSINVDLTNKRSIFIIPPPKNP